MLHCISVEHAAIIDTFTVDRHVHSVRVVPAPAKQCYGGDGGEVCVYEPLLQWERDRDGRPKGAVLWLRHGQPTLVIFTLILDSPAVRHRARDVARAGLGHAPSTVYCEARNAMTITHHHPLAAPTVGPRRPRTSRHVYDGGAAAGVRLRMQPCVLTPGYVEDSIRVYFRRSGGDWDNDALHQGDQLAFMEEEILEDCLAAVMGTLFLAQCNITSGTDGSRKCRLEVLKHHVMGTQLHRVLIAHAIQATDLRSHLEEDLVSLRDRERFLSAAIRGIRPAHCGPTFGARRPMQRRTPRCASCCSSPCAGCDWCRCISRCKHVS